ncbi:hypothetical protein [Pseudonocardia yunnanensis]|uniref:Uncharacterized protein n=1 Tax=Pseudonocardia yunnanensis TaxID=58107 RepID=A0ABW4F5V6_9PSEU
MTSARRARGALIGGHDPEFEGGTFAVVQKYLPDLTAWNAPQPRAVRCIARSAERRP